MTLHLAQRVAVTVCDEPRPGSALFCIGVVMKLNSFCQLIFVGTATLGLAANINGCRKPPKQPQAALPQEVRNGSYKVTMDIEKGSAEQLLEKLQSHAKEVATTQGCGVELVEPVAWEQGALSKEMVASYHVLFSNCEISTEKLPEVLANFEEKDGIMAIEAEAVVKVDASENDPYKANQYHLKSINRDAACNALGGQRGQEVVVAVIDSGVDMDHPDLVGSFYRNASGQVVGANFVGKGARLAPDGSWDDTNGHGTHVAGLIAATANNKVGIVGVGACAQVKIMPIRVMGPNGTGNMVEIDRGVQWAISQGADVINLSLGGNVYFSQKPARHPSPLYAEAAARGIVVFAAAGNEGLRLGELTRYGYAYAYPASYDNVISVAATDASDRLVSFSNRGDTVDIAAPGFQDLSTLRGGGYGPMSGTSMASPVAAGAYALALSAARQTRQERIPVPKALPLVQSALRGQSISKMDVATGGVLDSFSLLQGLKGAVAPIAQKPLPTDPNNLEPEIPVQPGAVALKFEGLTENQSFTNSQKITVSGWPKGQTVAVYLFWKPAAAPLGFTFAILTADHVSADGKRITTHEPYFLLGEGTLIAESIDVRGVRNGLASIRLKGR